MNPKELAIGIVALSGGKLVGRTRLQKTAYMLDQLGLRSGLDYEYHYYGPYALALAEGWNTAREENRLDLEDVLGRHLVPYTIFRTTEPGPARLGSLPAAKAKAIVERLGRESDLVLEVAATMHFLSQRPDIDDAELEVKRRKPLKATHERVVAAIALLKELGLAPTGRLRPPPWPGARRA
jgi:uncharacterized protein